MRRANKTDLGMIDPGSILPPASGEKLLYDSIAEGLALRLRASGAKSWVLFDDREGRRVRTTLGNAQLIPLATARAMTSPPPPTPTAAPPPALIFDPDASVAKVMVGFLRSGKGGRWKPQTWINMRAAADTHILPPLGKHRVNEITAAEVARWHRAVAARSTSARMALSTLSGLMVYAEDHGLRPPGTNPCKGLRKKERGNRGQAIEPRAFRRLWRALDKLQQTKPDGCDAIRLLILTGARRSEILSLQWDWIDGCRAVLPDSKEGPRTIWLNEPARNILEARKANRTGPYVFPAQRRDGPVTVLDRIWAALRKEADLGRLRVHDLRHHYASVGVSNGIDLRLVGQLLGHADIESTLGYAHLATQAVERSATRVSDLIERTLCGTPSAPGRRSKDRASALPVRKGEDSHD
jgi:integrase